MLDVCDARFTSGWIGLADPEKRDDGRVRLCPTKVEVDDMVGTCLHHNSDSSINNLYPHNKIKCELPDCLPPWTSPHYL